MSGTVLVIDSEGFIGNYVCHHLIEHGYDVMNFDKTINPNMDTLYFDSLPKTDYIINLAGLVGLKYCLDNPINAIYQNTLGVTRLLEHIKNTTTVFIHISTWAVEGKLENPYDITKLAGENMVMSYIKRGLVKGCVCRLGTAYGKGMSKLGVIPTMVKRMRKGQALIIHGRGDQIRQFTHVWDIAQGIIAVMEKGENQEIYNVVSDEVVSVKQIADLFSSNIQYKEKREGDEEYNPIDNIKLKMLGWTPKVKFKDGVQEIKNWIQ